MRISNKIAGILGLLAVFSALSLVQPAQAQYFNFQNLIRDYLGTGPAEREAPNQAFIRSNLDTAQAQLETEISAGLSSGRLSASEAAELRARMGQIASREANYTVDGGLSYGEVRTLMDELSAVQDRLLLATGHSGSVIIGNEVDAKQAELSAKISAALADGRITATQAANLRFSLRRITELEDNFRANDGSLTADENSQLIASLSRLSARLNQSMGTGVVAKSREIDRMQKRLRNRISIGLSEGRLTREEANMLLRQWNNLDRLEANYRHSGGMLTKMEITNLTRRLENLDRVLTAELNDRQFASRY